MEHAFFAVDGLFEVIKGLFDLGMLWWLSLFVGIEGEDHGDAFDDDLERFFLGLIVANLELSDE